MNEFLFDKNDIDLIKIIWSQNPTKIWFEHTRCVFEYVSFNIELHVELAEKFLIETILISEYGNKQIEQYVMTAKFEKINSEYKPSSVAALISENEKIIEISIARTMLSFVKPKQFAENKNSFQNDSFLINPKLASEKISDKQYLVDVGIKIHTESKILNCFILENDEDFDRNEYFSDIDLNYSELYEFININAS